MTTTVIKNISWAPLGSVPGVADSLNRVGLVCPGCQSNPGSRTNFFFKFHNRHGKAIGNKKTQRIQLTF